MLKKIALGCCLAVIGTSVHAAEMVSVSGHFLGGYNYLDQDSYNRAQFDYAANIDFELNLSDRIKGIVQLQTGAGNGSIGYVGPGAEVTDLNLEYTRDSGYVFTFGSFDTPFGQEVSYLTNNADSSKSVFLNNSLLYSALAGPAGTLNTLGLLLNKETSYGDWKLALTNGTGENAANQNDTFEYVLNYGTGKLLPGLYTSATYMNSDDSPDASSELTNSFGTEFTAWVVDAKYDFTKAISAKVYLGGLEYNDGASSTDDSVAVAMFELHYKTDKKMLGARISTWVPEDNNGDATGMSADLPFPGYATSYGTFTQPVDATITRFQVGYGCEFEPNVWLKGEAFVDQVEHGETVNGVVAYVNAAF